MKIIYSPTQLKQAAQFISSNNIYIEYSPHHIEEVIYDMIRDVADKVRTGEINSLYFKGTLGFEVVAHTVRGDTCILEVWVDPSVSLDRQWVEV